MLFSILCILRRDRKNAVGGERQNNVQGFCEYLEFWLYIFVIILLFRYRLWRLLSPCFISERGVHSIVKQQQTLLELFCPNLKNSLAMRYSCPRSKSYLSGSTWTMNRRVLCGASSQPISLKAQTVPSFLGLMGSTVHSSFSLCSMVHASPVMHVLFVLFIISTTIESNGSFSVLRVIESVCERPLSAMTRSRVSALVMTSELSVSCSASATVCRAVGRQEANARAAIRRKRYFALFIQ